jgi:hypothetical protein
MSRDLSLPEALRKNMPLGGSNLREIAWNLLIR